MDSSVSAFLNHLRNERQASGHTLRSYEHDLGLYCHYLSEAQGEGADPRAARSESVASLFGLVERAGVRCQHGGTPFGEPTLILPISSQTRCRGIGPVGRST